jgi:hypothetical protein
VSGAGGAGGTGIRIVDIVGSLDGRLIQYPCSAQTTSDTCPVANYWVGGVMGPCRFGEMVLTHTIGGTPGATYLVTMHFYGIMEPKNFGANVQRDGGTTRPENLDSGARPSPWAVPQGSFDSTATSFSSYEIHVFRTYNQEVGVYFLNSDTEESNTTYVIDYEKTIPVIGGGFVELRRGDTDCVQQKNCGATSGFPCASRARSVDVSAVSPQPPPPATASQGGFWQPGLGFPTDDAGQWWLIDVTAVTPM